MNTRLIAKYLTPLILLMVIVAILVWWFVPALSNTAAPPTASTPAPTQRVTTVNGVTVVTLDMATQAQSGIRAEPLSGAEVQAETSAYGTVLDLQPLMDQRVRYDTARADADAARAMLAASRQEYERSRVLYQDNQNISLKTYQAAQASYRADQARADAAGLKAQNLRAEVQQQFGVTLARWALAARSAEFARLLSRQDVLLRVTLPIDVGVAAPARIQIEANTTQRLPAFLVSPSPQIDPVIQGSAFIYRTASPIATGTNVVAYLPASKQTIPGILIPASAIVWYGGQPWAYVQISNDRFGRYPVAQQSPMQGGFVVSQGFKQGQRVVVSGAQLLLSEELRPPPGSTGCKDPECD